MPRRIELSAAVVLHLQAISPAGLEWLIVDEGFVPAREHDLESIFAVGNGYIGTRGSLAENGLVSNPGTFLAGVYDRSQDSVAELVDAPDWATLKVWIEDELLRLDSGEVIEHYRLLDMRRGLFRRYWRHRDRHGRTTRMRFTRFVSLADRQALIETIEITPENYCGRIVTESLIENGDGGVGPLERVATSEAPPTDGGSCHVAGGEPFLLAGRTLGSNILIAFAATTRLRGVAEDECDCERTATVDGVGERWTWEADIGEPCTIEKLTAVSTSREHPDPIAAAREHVSRLSAVPCDRLLEDHTRAWIDRWDQSDVILDGDESLQRGVRFAVYHLNAVANPGDGRSSIGARALTGEAYLGHVFWDTEVYTFPFYLYTHPESARCLLDYRYNTLPAAREKAKHWGYRGALYAWESADTGREESPSIIISPDGLVLPVRTGEMEHHISADVAHAVWQYYRVTHDVEFLRDKGAEILLETSRFWASRGSFGLDGRYHIRHIIGPDEYHEDVTDNAYTNGMATANIRYALACADLLQKLWPEHWRELAMRLDLRPNELAIWRRIADRMSFSCDPRTGVTEQFQGYFGLEDVDIRPYEPILVPLDLLLGRERVAASEIIKQPDVVMLDYLMWDDIPAERRAADFRYYLARCSNSSSLSPSIQAAVAARLRDSTVAARQLDIADDIDLADTYGNAAGGVHIGALGGLWQAVVCGFGGVRASDDALVLDPWLLPAWTRLAFPVTWRGTRLRVEVVPGPLRALVEHVAGPPAMVRIGGPDGLVLTAADGGRFASERDRGGWGPWQRQAR